MSKLHFEILDPKRQELLPSLKIFKEDFYLAGGTALAVQLAHRDSIDFDFFSQKSFNPDDLYKTIEATLKHYQLKKIQEDKDTLSILVDETIKISFFAYPYPLIEELIQSEHITLASILDIACMKLSAITGRATAKDYVDLYYIMHKYPLKQLLTSAGKKYPTLDQNLILKSLVYFEDIEEEPLLFKAGKEISLGRIKQFLQQEVKALIV